MDSALDKFITAFQSAVANRQYTKAADPLLTSVMNSASLRRELADRFINLVVDESVLLRDLVRVHRTTAPSGDITKLNVTGYVTRGLSENATGTETRRPSDSVLTFTTAKTQSIMDVTSEWLEDNVEGESGRSTIVQAFTRAIANDMETLAIEGDTSAVGSDDKTALISTNDGYHVLTGEDDGVHIVNAGNKRASFDLLAEMLASMPTKWKRDITQLRFMMSWRAAHSLMTEFADRVTAFGDKVRQDGSLGTMLGIPVVVIPKIPEDLALSGTDSTGSFIWLTVPRNFIFVVQRDFRAEWERVPRQDHDELTIHMRTDFLVENTDAVVKATNVGVDSTTALYGA